MRGKMIIIDGGEGCGKSVMVKHLETLYTDDSVVFTREPGGSVFGERIRETILSVDAEEADGITQFALMWAARRDHVKNLIEPALLDGRHVVCDRFDSSTYAYQVKAQEAPELRKIFFEMRKVVLADVIPDMYLYLDVNPAEGLRRAKNRRGKSTHFDERDLQFHHRVRDGFREFLKEVPHQIIDADQPIESVKLAVADAIKNVLE